MAKKSPVPASTPLTRQTLKVVLPADEARRIRAAAAAEDKTISDFAREVLVPAANAVIEQMQAGRKR